MPNRTIYLTKEQDILWQKNLEVLRTMNMLTISEVCSVALKKYIEDNADLTAALQAVRDKYTAL